MNVVQMHHSNHTKHPGTYLHAVTSNCYNVIVYNANTKFNNEKYFEVMIL